MFIFRFLCVLLFFKLENTLPAAFDINDIGMRITDNRFCGIIGFNIRFNEKIPFTVAHFDENYFFIH